MSGNIMKLNSVLSQLGGLVLRCGQFHSVFCLFCCELCYCNSGNSLGDQWRFTQHQLKELHKGPATLEQSTNQDTETQQNKNQRHIAAAHWLGDWTDWRTTDGQHSTDQHQETTTKKRGGGASVSQKNQPSNRQIKNQQHKANRTKQIEIRPLHKEGAGES